ncbi:hypothetical protein D3C72_1602050 [compost metagenome]
MLCRSDIRPPGQQICRQPGRNDFRQQIVRQGAGLRQTRTHRRAQRLPNQQRQGIGVLPNLTPILSQITLRRPYPNLRLAAIQFGRHTELEALFHQPKGRLL